MLQLVLSHQMQLFSACSVTAIKTLVMRRITKHTMAPPTPPSLPPAVSAHRKSSMTQDFHEFTLLFGAQIQRFTKGTFPFKASRAALGRAATKSPAWSSACAAGEGGSAGLKPSLPLPAAQLPPWAAPAAAPPVQRAGCGPSLQQDQSHSTLGC